MKVLSDKYPFDYSIVFTTFSLVLAGLLCLFSATADTNGSVLHTDFIRQVLWAVVGTGIFIGVCYLPVRYLFGSAFFIYGLSLLLLVLVLVFKQSEVNRWFSIGFLRFQPSELGKAGTLLLLARYLSENKSRLLEWKRLIVAIFIVLLPFFLIVREPDMGTAFVYIVLLAGMTLWAGLDRKTVFLFVFPLLAFLSGFSIYSFIVFLFFLVVIVIKRRKIISGILTIVVCFGIGLLAPKLWNGLEFYQRQRILIFLGLKSDPHGAAYQAIQSKVAIGSGGMLGKGFLHGTQTQLRFLPEQHTDFIFSVLGEEFGFLGSVVVLGLYLLLLLRIFNIARSAHDKFSGLLLIGIASILSFQVIVNIGMTVGLLPVVGLPLPFFSYGGSSFIVFMILAGLANAISIRRFDY